MGGRFKALGVLFTFLSLGLYVSSCFIPGPPGQYVGPQKLRTIHIDEIELPASIVANQPAAFQLVISADTEPLITAGGQDLYFRESSSAFAAGVTNGSYEAGQFVGIYLPGGLSTTGGTLIGPAAPTIVIPLTFATAGRQVVYFGHAKKRSQGGEAFEPDGLDYPAESYIIEYLKVEVNVNP